MSGLDFTLDQLVEKIIEVDQHKCRDIVFTGGEPALQLDGDLCRAIKDKGFLAIETNGTKELPRKDGDDPADPDSDFLDVADLLGLYDMTAEEHRAFSRRLERVKKVLPGVEDKPEALLDKMMIAVLSRPRKKKRVRKETE